MLSIFGWVARLFTIFKLSNAESSTQELKAASKLPATQRDAATSLIIKQSDAGDPSRVARRFIAISVSTIYLLSYLVSAIAMPHFHEYAEYIRVSITSELEKPFMIILVAYFSTGGIRDLKTGIMGMFK